MLETASLQHWGKTLVALSCAAFLSACGGGGGDKTSTPASEVNVSSSLSSMASLASSSRVMSVSSTSTLSSTANLSSASSINIASAVSSSTNAGDSSSSNSLSSTSSLISSSSVSSFSSVKMSSSLTSSSSSVAPDTTPDAFSFTPVTGALLNTSITSDTVIINGINTATPISITGGQYAINDGAPTNAAGTITQGQTAKVTLTTAATAVASAQAVLTVGDVSATFTVTTTNVIGGAPQTGQLNIANSVTTLAGSTNSTDGIGLAASFNYPSDVVSDGTNLYVADSGNNKIRKIEIATGVVTTLAGSGVAGGVDGTGTAASFFSPNGITINGANLYVVDTNNNRIRKIVIATGAVSTLAGGIQGTLDGERTEARFFLPTYITSDGENLYVTEFYTHTIRKIVIATGVVTTLAGNGSQGSIDGTGTAASFNEPTDITNDGINLYVADTKNNKIRKIVIATGVVTTLAGSGSIGSTNGVGTEASFNSPKGIISDSANLYVADSQNNTIRKIVMATGVVSTFAGIGTFGSTDGSSTAASFGAPQGITSDGTNLYITDISTHKIRKIVIATGQVTTLAGNSSYDSVDGRKARFNQPKAITSDGANLYVADTWNNKIRKIVIATGAVTTLAGSGEFGSADGNGTMTSFFGPNGITNDGTHLYVANTYSNQIKRIVIATGAVSTLAGSGLFGGADGAGTAASFAYPAGITSDGTNLYVSDTYNHKIRKILITTGEVSTLAGGDSNGSADGTGTAASFNEPRGITSDGTNLFVTDSGNYNIRKIVIATGAVTTLAGSGSFGSDDGTGKAASFTYPAGITSDGTNLYVTDSSNNNIRKIVIATGEVTTLAGSGSQGSADGVGSAASFYDPSGITSDGYGLFVTDTGNNTIRKIH